MLAVQSDGRLLEGSSKICRVQRRTGAGGIHRSDCGAAVPLHLENLPWPQAPSRSTALGLCSTATLCCSQSHPRRQRVPVCLALWHNDMQASPAHLAP